MPQPVGLPVKLTTDPISVKMACMSVPCKAESTFQRDIAFETWVLGSKSRLHRDDPVNRRSRLRLKLHPYLGLMYGCTCCTCGGKCRPCLKEVYVARTFRLLLQLHRALGDPEKIAVNQQQTEDLQEIVRHRLTNS